MNLHPDTLLLHGAYAPDDGTGATVTGIAQSASFAYETAEGLEDVFAGRAPGFVYSRIANPTVAQFERRMTALEDGRGSLACASGMAAISAAVLGLAGAGDEIISGNSVFGGTYSLFKKTLARTGITTRFVEATEVDAYRRAITDRTKLIFVETIGNPKLDVPDLAAIAAVAREHGVVLAVDNTVTTPVLLRPKMLGADLVIHSTSKFINGHGNAIGGLVVDTGLFDWSSPRYPHLHALHKRAGGLAFLAFLRNQIVRDLGCSLSPFNAFLMSIGVESLAVRMERHGANAERVAAWLAQHPKVAEVRYPGLKTHAGHDLAGRQFQNRYGAVITLRLGTKAACFKFINGLERVLNLANLGDAKSLVIHPASTFCREFNDDERRAVGVTDDLVRLSVGIEHAEDILSDLEQSLKAL
jgi:O-acetylhomoserine (thiol)-lyase